MKNLEVFDKAEEKINEILKLRDVLIEASPFFNDAKANITWYRKVCLEIPEKCDEILSLLEDPLKGTIDLNPILLDMTIVTGATGSYHAISGETKGIIQSFGSQYYNLITEYDALNNTDVFIKKIIGNINLFRPELKIYNPAQALLEAQGAYEKWEANILSDSELAGNIRTFQDKLYGVLHLARVALSDKKRLVSSWPKMAEALATNAATEKLLKNMQKIEEEFHLKFTKVLKKEDGITKKEMTRHYRDYIEHVYAILSLIKIDLLK